MKKFSLLFISALIISCSSNKEKKIPLIGFLDLLQDETLAQAKTGFYKSLSDNGYDEKNKTLEIIYRNAQGDQPSLLQACDYMISEQVDLIASCPTLSTIAAVQKTKSIPVFMMVSPSPDLAGLVNKENKVQQNLFGVYETLEYIDTSIMLIHQVIPGVKKIGAIFNQSEPQSVNALNEIKKACAKEGIEIIAQSVNSSNETQLVVQALLSNKVDAFFALPDNVVFSSMEVIVKVCDYAKIPIFTSEEGLVKRGALAAFGADMFQWGYQAGEQAAKFLKQKSLTGIKPEIVSLRRKVFNKGKAEMFNVNFDNSFIPVQ